MFQGKPIIGLSGGIGSGKTYIGKLFAEQGCTLISSDELVRDVYKDERVKHELRKWWGPLVFSPDGSVDRSAVSRKVFGHPTEKQRLETLLHPLIDQIRQRIMQQGAENPEIRAYIWDSPLLFETGLNARCDVTVFVDAPLDLRIERVRQRRGWDAAELARRENSQLPLDKKRHISDYVVVNTADETSARGQVRELISRILSEVKQRD